MHMQIHGRENINQAYMSPQGICFLCAQSWSFFNVYKVDGWIFLHFPKQMFMNTLLGGGEYYFQNRGGGNDLGWVEEIMNPLEGRVKQIMQALIGRGDKNEFVTVVAKNNKLP